MNIENEASKTIAALSRIGTKEANQEASSLGQILGNYRRGRLGDSMLTGSISAAKNRFSIQ